MRKFMLALGAMSLAVPASFAFPTSDVQAQSKKNRYKYRGQKRCRHSSGTTGLIAGGVGGAVLGNAVGGGLLGTVAGGAAGALGGRAIDRSMTADKRCRYR